MAKSNYGSDKKPVTLSLQGPDLLVRFPYSKRRFDAIKRVPGARYDKGERSWRLPVLSLEKLQNSRYFPVDLLECQFDDAEFKIVWEAADSSRVQAWDRLAANPFEVSEEDISAGDPEIVFRWAARGQGLRAFIRSYSTGKKKLESVPGVHYIKTERSYFFPVEMLTPFLKELRASGTLFAVEETAGKRLKQYAHVRQACTKGAKLERLDLCESALVPCVDFDGQQFQFVDWTTEQLRIAIPDAAGFADRKQQSLTLTRTSALAACWRLAVSGCKVYFGVSALQAFKQSSESLGVHPAEGELLLHSPCFAWVRLAQGQCGLLSCRASVESDKRDDFDALCASFAEKAIPFFPLRDSFLFPVDDLYCAEGVTYLASACEKRGLPQPVMSLGFCSALEGFHLREARYKETQEIRLRADVQCNLQNAALEEKLFPHQRTAVKWLLQWHYGLLGDDMGLGKTLSVLAAYEELRSAGDIDFLLVICPNSLARNWCRESLNWLDDTSLLRVAGTKKERTVLLHRLDHEREIKGCVVNYETFRLDDVQTGIRKLCEDRKVFLCVDESQRVKNSQSKTFKALSTVAPLCKRRVLLSGTPCPLAVSDLWSQMFLIDGGQRLGDNYYAWLETVAELGNSYSKFAVQKFRTKEVEKVVSRVQEVMLRRKKEEVINLPLKTFSIRDVELTGNQKQRFDTVREELAVQMQAKTGKVYEKEIDNILEEYLRAVQIASNPRLVNPSWEGTPAKFTELDGIVDEVVRESEEKLVIWTNYLHNVTELCERYKSLGSAAFSGQVSAADRQQIVQDFQTPNSKLKILVAVPAAGGVGITLTAAQTAVYLDKTWNGEHWMQSIDRIHRIGQQGTVAIISLHATAVDELISWNLMKKAKMQSKVFQDGLGIDHSPIPKREELLAALSA